MAAGMVTVESWFCGTPQQDLRVMGKGTAVLGVMGS